MLVTSVLFLCLHVWEGCSRPTPSILVVLLGLVPTWSRLLGACSCTALPLLSPHRFRISRARTTASFLTLYPQPPAQSRHTGQALSKLNSVITGHWLLRGGWEASKRPKSKLSQQQAGASGHLLLRLDNLFPVGSVQRGRRFSHSGAQLKRGHLLVAVGDTQDRRRRCQGSALGQPSPRGCCGELVVKKALASIGGCPSPGWRQWRHPLGPQRP